jgi:hypothetical protein
MKDPVKKIGDRILAATPNTEMLIRVDFSIRDVSPPRPGEGKPRSRGSDPARGGREFPVRDQYRQPRNARAATFMRTGTA